jgi:hypothetical protein
VVTAVEPGGPKGIDLDPVADFVVNDRRRVEERRPEEDSDEEDGERDGE